MDHNFQEQHGKYSGWTAQIIQHEMERNKYEMESADDAGF